MKRIGLLLVAVFALCLLLLPASAENTEARDAAEQLTGKALMPGSLLSIGEEAFEGTALSEVRISDSVSEIAERAFAQIESLRLLYIPRSVEMIGADMVADSPGTLITGSENSFAKIWAKQNRIPFSLEQLLTRVKRVRQVASVPPAAAENEAAAARNGESCIAERQAPRPGRTVGELKASQFKGLAAQYIQSRFFP